MFRSSMQRRPQRPAMPLWAILAYFGVVLLFVLGLGALDMYRRAAQDERTASFGSPGGTVDLVSQTSQAVYPVGDWVPAVDLSDGQ